MSTTITGLYPELYAALDVVSRELVGLIPSVTIDGSINRASKDQTVRSMVSPAAAALQDITPAMSIPTETNSTLGYTDIVITKAKFTSFTLTGGEQNKLNTGTGYLSSNAQRMAQAMRLLTNSVEADLAALHTTFSRAYGTAGTTPFATAGDFTDASETMRILADNGAPMSDNSLVMNTAAGAKMIGKQSQVYMQGSDNMLRQGVLLDTAGLSLRQSAQILTSTAGTGASATTNNAGYSVGDTVITLASAGTGTIVAGDVVTFAGDTNKYVVVSGDADVSGGGTITLAEPGLRVAMSAATKAITIVAAAARNMAFNRSAIVLATRLPERPAEGDLALDVGTIVDPRSGLAFEVAIYPGNRMVQYQIGLAWGVKNVKPEHTALLLG